MTERVIPKAVPRSHRYPKLAHVWRFRVFYLFLIPAVAWYLVFCYWPMYGLLLAFKDYKFNAGIWGSRWVGLQYFQNFLKDHYFFVVLKNTLVISGLKLLINFPAPIVLALIFNTITNRHFKRISQTVSYLPHFVSWVVVIGLLNKLFSPYGGLINDLRVALDPAAQPHFYVGDVGLFYWFVVFSEMWKEIGWGTILYLAALSNIDPMLYEAADIDGAGRWSKLFHITMPCLYPTVGVLLILSMSGILNAGFEQILLLQTPPTMAVSEILDTYILAKGIKQGQVSYAVAIGFFKSVVSLMLIILVNNLSRKFTEVSVF